MDPIGEHPSSSTTSTTTERGHGRGRSRGGLGKHLRARGRRGYGRPAEWGKRLVLEDEEEIEDAEQLEAIREKEIKYARRELSSNVDRYVEEEPVLDSEGTPTSSSRKRAAKLYFQFLRWS
jgi:hypothetical protein